MVRIRTSRYSETGPPGRASSGGGDSVQQTRRTADRNTGIRFFMLGPCVPRAGALYSGAKDSSTWATEQVTAKTGPAGRRRKMTSFMALLYNSGKTGGDVAQLGRAPESHSGGRGFEPLRLHHCNSLISRAPCIAIFIASTASSFRGHSRAEHRHTAAEKSNSSDTRNSSLSCLGLIIRHRLSLESVGSRSAVAGVPRTLCGPFGRPGRFFLRSFRIVSRITIL